MTTFQKICKGHIVAIIIALCVFQHAQGTIPALRTEISLNGKWNFTPEGKKTTQITVPEFWDALPDFKDVKHAVYERKIKIPSTADWRDKIIRIEFEAVNFIAEVFINNQRVGQHIGGFIPFTIDISKWAKPGTELTLKVDVKGGCYLPVSDTSGAPLWPVGFFGQQQRWGIVFGVWLRAYGKVGIEDAFVQTSYRKKEIAINYTIFNQTTEKQMVNVSASIIPANRTNDTVLNLTCDNILLNPGEKRVINLAKQWSNPHCWGPDDPFLYHLHSQITVNGMVLDWETRRFGFREIWIEGNQYWFNGHPFTVMGTNFVQHSEFYDSQRYLYFTPQTWNSTIDRLFELNLRTVRFHMQPAPQWALDVADERGLLVINESGIYAREYILKSNKTIYLENCKTWIKPWIIANRNHPCIIMWSAENEMGRGWLNWMTDEEIKSLGDEIRHYDTTRPVIYQGDGDVGDATINLHYPEIYAQTVSGSIYSWADKVSKYKPTGVGEFITHYGKFAIENQWWQGTWVRGMRYVGFADIRPYRHDWAWLSTSNNARIENLKNGFSPVAVFDKEYDDFGIAPFLYQQYPELQRGDTARRTLVIYNDEFADTLVTVEVLIRTSEKTEISLTYGLLNDYVMPTWSSNLKTFAVPLGTHIEIACTFTVPNQPYMFVDMELIARKEGKIKFKEIKRFKLTGSSKSTVEPWVKIGKD